MQWIFAWSTGYQLTGSTVLHHQSTRLTTLTRLPTYRYYLKVLTGYQLRSYRPGVISTIYNCLILGRFLLPSSCFNFSCLASEFVWWRLLSSGTKALYFFQYEDSIRTALFCNFCPQYSIRRFKLVAVVQPASQTASEPTSGCARGNVLPRQRWFLCAKHCSTCTGNAIWKLGKPFLRDQ